MSKYFLEWMVDGAFVSEVHESLEVAQQRMAQLDPESVNYAFLGELCPRCNRSRNEGRSCRHCFHEGDE